MNRGTRHSEATRSRLRAAWVGRRSRLPDFWSRAQRQDDGCLIWQRGLTSEGYGQAQIDGQNCLAHRVAFERARGPIPVGLTLDHLCRNRACIEPHHLEAVTIGENIRRGIAPSAVNARATCCRWGHAFDALNTRVRPNGSRACRQCEKRVGGVKVRRLAYLASVAS